MCAIGDALYDYDNDIVKFRGLQSTINDHDGISWLQFMLDRLQQIPCTPCPTNVDGMDSEVLKELVRAWQEVHDEKMALYRHLVAVVRVHLDYRVKGQEPFIQPKLLKPWDSKASEPAVRTDWKSATVAKSGPFQSFADMFTESERSGRSYTWDDRSWKCVGTHGLSSGIAQFQTGSGRWVCTSCPACSRSVRMFFVPEDTKTLRAGWYIEKAGEHTHEPKPRLKVSAGSSTEKPNGIHATWAPLVDFGLNLNASPARIIEELTDMAGDNPLKISLLPKTDQVSRRKKYLKCLQCAMSRSDRSIHRLSCYFASAGTRWLQIPICRKSSPWRACFSQWRKSHSGQRPRRFGTCRRLRCASCQAPGATSTRRPMMVACVDEAHSRYCTPERRCAGFAFSSLKQMKLLMQLSEDHGLVAFLLDCTAKPLAEKRQVTLKKALPGVLLRTLSVLCSFALQW